MRAYHEIRRSLTGNPCGVEISRTDHITFPAHWHHDVEIILCLQGEIWVGIAGRNRRMRAGDIAIAQSGDIHWYDEGRPGACDIFLFIFPPQLLGVGRWPVDGRFATPFFTTRQEGAGDHATVVSEDVLSSLQRLLEDIHEEYPHRDAAHADLLRARIGLFCGMAMRLLPLHDASEPGERKHREQTLRIQSALAWLEENYLQEVSLEMLADRLNIGYHHLSRLFGDVVGTSFPQHLNRLRINEADRLLAESALSITEIALQCGFNSLRTFNRAYRAIHGRAPSEAG